jgi:hypothetical protein
MIDRAISDENELVAGDSLLRPLASLSLEG